MKKITFCFLMAFSTFCVSAQNFTSGNLVVLRVGDGVTPIGTTTAPVSLVEFSPTGTSGVTVAIPSIGTNKFTLSGNESTSGQLNLSQDGKYLLMVGYDQIVAQDQASARTGQMVIGRINSGGIVDLSTKFTPPGGSTPRNVASINGADLYVNVNTNLALYTTFGGTTVVNTGFDQANRTLNVFNNQLYTVGNFNSFSSSNPALPTDVGASNTTIFNPNLGVIGWTLMDVDATVNWNDTGYDVLYISAVGGLRKYSWNGTAWTLVGTIAGDMSSVTAIKKVDGNVVLYALTGSGGAINNNLVTLTDSTGYAGDISALAPTVIATAGDNYAFRGVAFAPTGSLNVDSNVFNENSVNVYKSNGTLNVSSTTKNINNANQGLKKTQKERNFFQIIRLLG
jgi:hypothetical protein